MKHVISLGAGVQSSTMALMAARGLIRPMPDAAVFADTQAEPERVYRWLKWLIQQLPFPVYISSKGPLELDAMERRVSGNTGLRYVRSLVPVWYRDPVTGKRGAGERRCTRDYKIKQIEKIIKSKVLLLHKNKRWPLDITVTSWIGISTDEAHRMKPAGTVKKKVFIPSTWAVNRYPLIDLGMSRDDCKTWMNEHGYPEPPRSACYFCPFHSGEEWARIRDTEPEEFAKALKFEREIQDAFSKHCEVTRGVPFLWYGLVPLAEANFNESNPAINHFGNECEGMCGI